MEQPQKPGITNGSTVFGASGPPSMRHPGEIPLLVIGIISLILGYLFWILAVIWLIIQSSHLGESLDDYSNLTGFTQDSFLAQFTATLGTLPLVIWLIRALMYAQLRAQGVRMSLTQFPEGYRMVAEAAAAYGLRRIPDAYVVSGGGEVNAFAAGHGFRRFVAINSDLFEIGGIARDPDALRFVISHEVGHIAAGHTSYFRLLLNNFLINIPFLGPAFSRAQEYTADNFGYTLQPYAAPGVIGVLAGGKYLNAEVNIYEMADRAATERGFWVHIVNWLATHPVLTWRAHALLDRSRAGRLFFRPKNIRFISPLPSGRDSSKDWPTPLQVLHLLNLADTYRDPRIGPQFGRFPGVDYTGKLSTREVQTSYPFSYPPITPPTPPGDTSKPST